MSTPAVFPTRRRLRVLPAAIALCLCASLAGCAYRAELRQGDERLLEKADALKTGMTRRSVQALLGEAAVPRLLRQDVLLYVYQHRPAGFDGALQQRTLELVFDAEDRLQEIRVLRDDFAAAALPAEAR